MTREITTLSIHDEMPVRHLTEDLGRGEWLALERLHIEHPNGKIHTWESVKRLKNRGAVVIIAKISNTAGYVLIRQYRPAIDSLVLEFPAGLIDPGADRGDDTADDDGIDRFGVKKALHEDRIFIPRPIAQGGQPETFNQILALKQAEFYLGIADIDGQKHGGVLFTRICIAILVQGVPTRGTPTKGSYHLHLFFQMGHLP